MRHDGRAPDQLRDCTIEPDYLRNALASVLISTGNTRVICSASMDPRPPAWLDKGGWVTAEYSMLPGSVTPRGRRDPGGRGKEIQRLIGRSLRAAVDLPKLMGPDGGISIYCDCDVIDADGGTRTASITGAWVAMAMAIRRLQQQGVLKTDPLLSPVAAVSVGIASVGDVSLPVLDLDYVEDSSAEVDFNVVQTAQGGLVEVQGTAERGTFSHEQLHSMLDLARKGIGELLGKQQDALRSVS